MAFLNVKKENVAKEGSGNFATTSGIFDINIKGVEVASTKNGATQVNYITDKFQSYGNTVVDTQGNRIFGMDILEALTAVIGEDGLSDPEPTKIKFKTQTKELMCLPELTDVDVKVWVQFGYELYKGEIKERVSVKRFYRQHDGASGSEVLAIADGENVVPGTQLAKDEAYASEVKYSDGLTEDDVKAWKKEKSEGNSASKPAAATASPKGAASAFPTRK